MIDNVKSPKHYKLDGLNIEVKDVAFAVIKNIKYTAAVLDYRIYYSAMIIYEEVLDE